MSVPVDPRTTTGTEMVRRNAPGMSNVFGHIFDLYTETIAQLRANGLHILADEMLVHRDAVAATAMRYWGGAGGTR